MKLITLGRAGAMVLLRSCCARQPAIYAIEMKPGVAAPKASMTDWREATLRIGPALALPVIARSFSRDQLSLVDRGWTVAIAHIRGGGYMGRKWYEVSESTCE